MGTQIIEEHTDIFLEEHDQRNHTHTDQLVENGAKQAHLDDLRHEEPDDDKHHDADEHIQGTRLTHQTVDVEQHQRHQKDIDNIY